MQETGIIAPSQGPRTSADFIGAYWSVKKKGSEEAGDLLLKGHAAYCIEQGDPDAPVYQYFKLACADRLDEPGSLYNDYDRALARSRGYKGGLTELAVWGRALRGNAYVGAMTPDVIERTELAGLREFARSWLDVPEGQPHALDELDSVAEMVDALLAAGLGALDIRKARVAALEAAMRVQKREVQAPLLEEKQRAYELVKKRDPDAPRGGLELERLVLQTFQELANVNPPAFDTALRRVQEGHPNTTPLPAVADKSAAYTAEDNRAPSYIAWGKQHGHDFVTGELPYAGQVYDAHHVPVGEVEARSTTRPHIMVFVARENHVPRPGVSKTAHHKAFSPHNDADKLRALLYYQHIERTRYEAHTRNEPDPYPDLPEYARIRFERE